MEEQANHFLQGVTFIPAWCWGVIVQAWSVPIVQQVAGVAIFVALVAVVVWVAYPNGAAIDD